jgi:hypothetical protein
MSERTHPKGSRLPALERNILKYRAFEMVLILFYCESLKALLTDSTDFVSILHPEERIKTKATNGRLKAAIQALVVSGTVESEDAPELERVIGRHETNALKKAQKKLVAEGFLTQAEADEIKRLINYRNTVAHAIHNLTGDVGRTSIARDFRLYGGGREYDLKARKRLHYYLHELPERLRKTHVLTISFAPLQFEAAEKTYLSELTRLRSKIDARYAARKTETARLNEEISKVRKQFVDEDDPYHPANKYGNGQLSKRGLAICRRLFEAGISPLAVAYMMRISYSAALARHKAWSSVRAKAKGRG